MITVDWGSSPGGERSESPERQWASAQQRAQARVNEEARARRRPSERAIAAQAARIREQDAAKAATEEAIQDEIDGLEVALLRAESERRATELASRLRGEVAALLRVDEAQIALRQPLTELGVDSLLALELVTALSARGFQISVVDLMPGPTVRGLAERQVAALANRLRESADELLASVDAMSEQEVEALLALLDEGEAGEALPRTSSDVAPHPDQRRAS